MARLYSSCKEIYRGNLWNKKKTVKKKQKKELPKISQPKSSDKIEKLQELINKYENGNISREEFNKQKKELLQN